MVMNQINVEVESPNFEKDVEFKDSNSQSDLRVLKPIIFNNITNDD